MIDTFSFRFNRFRAALVLALVSLLFFAGVTHLYAASRTVGNGTPASCTETALRNVITASNSGDKIVFSCGTNLWTIGLTSSILIDKDLSMDGGSKITLTTNQTEPIFDSDGGTLTLANITLNNAKSVNGGCMWVGTGLIATNVQFQNCHATGTGGAIYNYGTTVLTDVTLSNSDTAGDGGGIYNHGTLTLNNVTLSLNTAGGGGGAVYNYLGTLTVTGGQWADNSASGFGGGLYNDQGPATLTRVKFVRNHSTGQSGGGIENYSATLHLTEVTLSANTAANDGGGIAQGPGTIIMHGGGFTGNISSSGGGGGGFWNGSTATLSKVKFKNNKSGAGAGIYSRGPLVLTKTVFANNQAANDGGGIYAAYDTVSIKDSTFSGNQAVYQGGGIFSDTVMTVARVTLDNNSAAQGGGIGNGGSLTLTNVTLSGDSATAKGGGIWTYNTGAAFNFVTFSGNSSPNGGALRVDAPSSVTLKNTVLASSPSGGNCSTNGITPVSQGHNLSDDNSCVSFFTQTADKNNKNAKLGALANNGGLTQTFMPGFKSPLIDRGDCTGGPATDQRGVSRPQHGKCDIGSVEVQ